MTPIQIAERLESFHHAHGGGSLIAEAAAALREQAADNAALMGAANALLQLTEYVRKNLGRRLSGVVFLKAANTVRDGRAVRAVKTTPAMAQKYETMMAMCERALADADIG